MQRFLTTERANWRDLAEKLGFIFHTMYGEPYWDETHYYAFTLDQIENDLEDPSEALHFMCLEAVDLVVNDEKWLQKLQIPRAYWDWIAASWKRRDPSIYGRFDLAYDGRAPAKLLEYNADTPTSLYESAFFQWLWLEDKIRSGEFPASADQYNSIQDKLIERFGALFEAGCVVHFASCKDTDEDRQTVRYIEDCASQAGLIPRFVYVEDIGIDAGGRYADSNEVLIENLFKLYPWEEMFRERFGKQLVQSTTDFLEPPWKSILSNKGLLPLLWSLFPDHPNLLPAYFEDDPNKSAIEEAYVRKPLFSREGANIDVIREGQETISVDGAYGEEGYILQAFTEIPKFGEDYAVIGSWMIGEDPVGIGIREDRSMVTKDLSRFVPHVIA